MGIFIVIVIIAIFIFLKFVKPYLIKYDNAILFTGGLGSGKTLNSVKVAKKCYFKNCRKIKFGNWVLRVKKCIFKFLKKDFSKFDYQDPMPLLLSNLPIRHRGKFISCELTKDVLTLKEHIPLKSVILWDEVSASVNQFNWNINEIQYHLNEFIQFFRHYSQGGYIILNAQAESEIVKQIRVKLNSYYICMNFRKFLCFYKVDIYHRFCSGGDVVSTSDFIDNDKRRVYGIINRCYDTHYLSERYKNVHVDYKPVYYKSLKNNKVIRFKDYESRCDNK